MKKQSFTIEELESILFDYICRYKLEKNKGFWLDEIMMFLYQFEENPLIRYGVCIAILETLSNLDYVRVK